jgi:hypothetical protein
MATVWVAMRKRQKLISGAFALLSRLRPHSSRTQRWHAAAKHQGQNLLGEWALQEKADPHRIVFFSFWSGTGSSAPQHERVLPTDMWEQLKPLIASAVANRVFDVRTKRRACS